MNIVDERLEQMEILRAAKFIREYVKCTHRVQAGIRKMLDILYDPKEDEANRQMAIATLADVLFPNSCKGRVRTVLKKIKSVEKVIGKKCTCKAVKQMADHIMDDEQRGAWVAAGRPLNLNRIEEILDMVDARRMM